MNDLGSNPAAAHPEQPQFLTPWMLPGLRCGFGGRLGGVSAGPFASFNLAGWIGDDPSAVAENWRRWQMMYPTMAAVRSNQVHGARVRKITRADAASVEDADGMVTAVAGLALCVYTADCVPILMVDPERRLVGALHAGWRGTLRNIAAAGVAAMVRLGARRETLRVALGPAIGRCCFEVDHELVDDFARAFPASARHSRAGKPGKAYLDLRAINCAQLSAEGIARQNLMQVGPCTRCANAQFFSRRAVPGGTSGLQMSFIGFVDED